MVTPSGQIVLLERTGGLVWLKWQKAVVKSSNNSDFDDEACFKAAVPSFYDEGSVAEFSLASQHELDPFITLNEKESDIDITLDSYESGSHDLRWNVKTGGSRNAGGISDQREASVNGVLDCRANGVIDCREHGQSDGPGTFSAHGAATQAKCKDGDCRNVGGTSDPCEVSVNGVCDCRVNGVRDCRANGVRDCRANGVRDCRVNGVRDCREYGRSSGPSTFSAHGIPSQDNAGQGTGQVETCICRCKGMPELWNKDSSVNEVDDRCSLCYSPLAANQVQYRLVGAEVRLSLRTKIAVIMRLVIAAVYVTHS